MAALRAGRGATEVRGGSACSRTSSRPTAAVRRARAEESCSCRSARLRTNPSIGSAAVAAAISASMATICAERLSMMISSERVARPSSQRTAASAMAFASAAAVAASPWRTRMRITAEELGPSLRNVSRPWSSSSCTLEGVRPRRLRSASASTGLERMAAT